MISLPYENDININHQALASINGYKSVRTLGSSELGWGIPLCYRHCKFTAVENKREPKIQISISNQFYPLHLNTGPRLVIPSPSVRRWGKGHSHITGRKTHWNLSRLRTSIKIFNMCNLWPSNFSGNKRPAAKDMYIKLLPHYWKTKATLYGDEQGNKVWHTHIMGHNGCSP